MDRGTKEGGRQFGLIALLLLSSVAALCEQVRPDPIDGVYRGTLGKQEIVAEVGGTVRKSAFPSTMPHFVGRYFYRRHGVAVMLKGDPLNDGSIRLREYQGDEATGSEWRLTFSGERAKGVFCKCDLSQSGAVGAQLKIELVRASRGFDPDLAWRKDVKAPDQAYYDLLLDFPLQVGPETRVGEEIAYVKQSDPRLQVSMLHLTRFPDAAVMARVNHDLARELRDRRLWVADCLGNGQAPGSYEEKVYASAFTRQLLSVVTDYTSFCGGAHPNGATETRLYNMSTGESFRLYALLHDEIDPARLRKYGDKENPLPFVLTDLYLAHYVLPSNLKADDCDGVLGSKPEGERPLVSTFSRWPDTVLFFDKQGIVIIPVLPHAYQGCGPAVTIPYGEILPMIREGGTFRSLVGSITADR